MGTQKQEPKLVVCHPMNSHGTTWLKESDLVFKGTKPIVVFEWAPGKDGVEPKVWKELNRKLLHHDRSDRIHYRYEGEIPDPKD